MVPLFTCMIGVMGLGEVVVCVVDAVGLSMASTFQA